MRLLKISKASHENIFYSIEANKPIGKTNDKYYLFYTNISNRYIGYYIMKKQNQYTYKRKKYFL